MSVSVYGRGTNIIVEGDVNASFPGSQAPMTLGFSNGAVLNGSFDGDGYFTIRTRQHGEQVTVSPRTTGVTDTAVVDGEVLWVVGGYNVADRPVPGVPEHE